MPRGAVIALSHGGGPMPVLGDKRHDDIVRSLKERVPRVLKLDDAREKPRAIIVVTAHWSESVPTISSAAHHDLYYDYYGFPAEAYRLKYDAPGAPAIATEVFNAMKEEGLAPRLDERRGWDHGVFIPMMLVRPEHDIPIVQLSVLSSESPSEHFNMGQALEKLRDANIAIIGSGFASFHNLSIMFSNLIRDPAFVKRNEAWSKGVTEAVMQDDEEARSAKLDSWRGIPGSYEMHPRGGAEHFMPLLVCAGAAGGEKANYYTDEFLGMDMYSYHWGSKDVTVN